MRPETEAYLRKKYRSAAILGDARDPDAVLEQEPEGEGMAPEELAQYRRPIVTHIPDAPLLAAEPDADEEALRLAAEQDAEARFRAGMTNASKKLGSAITAGLYKPDYVKPEVGALSAEQERQKQVRDYLLRKRGADTNAMNAEAALLNARRDRKVAEPKEADPLDAELKQARIEETKARTEKAKRVPVPKEPKNPDGEKLPVSALNELADIDVATGMLDRLEKDFQALEQSGTWAKYRAKAADSLGEQSGPAAQYAAKAKLAMQAVGKILEGGKLAAGDEVKYREMLPKAGDSLDVLRAKSSGMRAFLQDLKTGRIRVYKAGGYKTKGIDDGEAPASGLSPEEAEELVRLEKKYGGRK